ncbi:hypothetical protein LCGC14_1966570, partial [marine sediment metagenome]
MFQVPDMQLALPEMLMLAISCFLLLFVAFTSNKKMEWVHRFAILGLFVTILSIVLSWGQTGQTFSSTYIKDPLSDLLKLSICLLNVIVLIYSYSYLKARQLMQGEFYVLAMFATLGMMIMVSAAHFITLYLGLELMSLCLYALVAMQRDSVLATEAAMKYFILGAIASGMLLYGMSIIYGVTGSLALVDIATYIHSSSGDETLLSFALVFIVIAIGFKFGAVPFH